MQRDPKQGKTPADEVPEQDPPGVEAKMRPEADHGEESYRGSGKLEGLAAVITGGDSGIGRAVAIAFAREGADVAVGYEAEKEDDDARETEQWVKEAGRECLVHRFDVREKGQCEGLAAAAAERFGKIDILVNNAAYQLEREGVEAIPEDDLDRTFRTNIYGYIFMVQAVLPHMPEGGVILNTGSVTALDGHPALIDYACTKGAIHVLTKSLAPSLAQRKIRVNCVAPGPVWTPLIPATIDNERVSEFGEDTVWERPAQPAEIAPSYVFLASTDGRYYTGEILAPTGRGTTR